VLLLGLWGLALAAVFLFPPIETASFFSTTLLDGREPFDFVSLYVPANPFASLANNVVPAVVLFSIVLGVALVVVPGKERLIDMLQLAGAAVTKATALMTMRMLDEYPPARIHQDAGEMPRASDDGDAAAGRIERIRARGVLRVGYLSDSLPFAFVNAQGDLVGLDVEMAHVLAGDLGVSLELTPVSRRDLAADLDGGACDVVMSGIAVTADRAAQMAFSASYLDETLAFVVLDHLREPFSSWDAIRSRGRLRIGVPPLPTYIAKIRRELPDAELVPIDSVDQVFADKTFAFDAIVLTAERGSAWTLVHPQYSVAIPRPQPIRGPLAYPIATRDEALAKVVSTWIELKQKDGTIDALFAHWILGRDASARQPRWSVIRNVLHWVA
jgi:ABC-type amino acid transport substrate-binding protein